MSATLDRALDWLGAAQLPTGELPAYAGIVGEPVETWDPDRLNFITALAVLALEPVADERGTEIRRRAVDFVRSQREARALWRYWADTNERHAFTPPDADDTACCSMAVATLGDTTAENVAVLTGLVTSDGRFPTWLIPHDRPLGPRLRWWLRAERRDDVQALRAELWSTTEAEPDDVDAVVNANVCRYLGAAAPAGAVEWVAGVVEAGLDSGDKWHRSPYNLWFSVADGARRGVRGFDRLAPVVIERIAAATGPDGLVGRHVDTALSLAAVQCFDGPADLRTTLADGLVAAQHPDGSWDRDIYYYGGPDEVFAWASEALVTAFAAGALAGEPGHRPDTP